VLSTDVDKFPHLTKAYKLLFDELASGRYVVRSVYEHYVTHGGKPDQFLPTVVLRIDVDSGFHLSWPLALHLHQRGLTATHFFLTHPSRYYNLWCSAIPEKIHKLGQEVGLHTDHYYEQLAFGVDGLTSIKNDVKKLSKLIGEPIKGMVYHGHNLINAFGTTNWTLTKDILPSELGLEYHDGLHSCYIHPDSDVWRPKCDTRLSDYMGVTNVSGWNYVPSYPLVRLKKYAKPSSTLHLAFHTMNAFEYWNNWPSTYQERHVPKESPVVFYTKKFIVTKRLIYSHLMTRLPAGLRKKLKSLIGRSVKT